MSIIRRSTFLSMLFLYVCALAVTSVVRAAPAPGTKFDQRQEGETNIRADLDNILIVLVPPSGFRLIDSQGIGSIISMLGNRRNTNTAVPAPASPYKVDIEQSAIDKLHADMDNMNSIIPASKSYIALVQQPEQKEDAAAVVEITGDAVKNEDSKGEEQKLPAKIDSETTVAPVVEDKVADATTMEAIVTSVNSYRPNTKHASEKEKVIDIAPASVTVFLTRKENEPQIVEIEKPSSVDAEKTPEVSVDEKKPQQQQQPEMETGATVPKDAPKEPSPSSASPPSQPEPAKAPTPTKVTHQQITTEKHHHHHHHNEQHHQQTVKHQQVQSTKKTTTTVVTTQEKNTKVSPAATPVQAPLAAKAIVAKLPKVLIFAEDEKRLESLQSGLVHCSPGQRLSYNGECVNIQQRQSRREDMERLLSALRFGVAPANQS